MFINYHPNFNVRPFLFQCFLYPFVLSCSPREHRLQSIGQPTITFGAWWVKAHHPHMLQAFSCREICHSSQINPFNQTHTLPLFHSICFYIRLILPLNELNIQLFDLAYNIWKKIKNWINKNSNINFYA